LFYQTFKPSLPVLVYLKNVWETTFAARQVSSICSSYIAVNTEITGVTPSDFSLDLVIFRLIQ